MRPESDSGAAWGQEFMIPLAALAIPPALFELLGLVTRRFAQPGLQLPLWAIVAMIGIQTAGIVAMAFVLLWRYESLFRRLHLITQGRPSFFRRLLVGIALICLLLAEIFSNVAAAFAGAEFLHVIALGIFVGYVLFSVAAFSGVRVG
jgi:hypothetical protein